MYTPRPRGRGRRGCVWDTRCGEWVSAAERERAPHQTSFVAAYANPERAQRETELALAAEEKAREAAEVAARKLADEREAKRKVEAVEARRNEPKRRAEGLWGIEKNTHVYYFDVDGNFQELNEEVERRPRPSQRMRRVVRVVEELVWGPDESRMLEEGESELVCKRVVKWVPA